jgi:HlyD family secretion protein
MPGANGRIESVIAKEGDEVKAGDPIAIIEDDTYLAQVKQAEVAVTSAKLNLAKMELGSRPEEIAATQAAVELARSAVNDVATVSDDERTRSAADLAKAEADLKAAQTEYDKIAWAGDVGSTPQALRLQQATITYQNSLAKYNLDTHPSDSQLAPLMLQQAQAELALALKLQPYRQIDFEGARAAIQQAQAALDLANIQLGEVVIKAPFDGIIATLNISKGSRVSPQTSVASFISKEVEVVVNVPENRIGQVEKDQSAAMQMTAYPGQDFPGVVSSIAPEANKDSRTFEVKITPTKGADLLRSGMYANVSILAQEKPHTLLAPRTAITTIDDKPAVFVVKGDNTVEQRPVTTGLFDQDNIEILSGLKEGDKVVTAGQSSLVEGAKVEVTNNPGVPE